MHDLDETWQADLVEMQPYAQENKSYKYLLTVIDVFSKYAWAIPLKQKTGNKVTASMKSILEQGRVPKNLHTDRGKEFYNLLFEGLMKRYGIDIYSTYSNRKTSTVSASTARSKTRCGSNLVCNYKWLDLLPDLLAEYNNSKHRTIGMKSEDISKKNKIKSFNVSLTKKKQK
ncbi:uncharacterized protein LOC107982136 [Nasonia vitripennis]|uniref:Integrase catalytic domain-containing protein n=1 Tax=Nasonia vitripennis TaxID=7425 RepID=A0A7M7IV99_NASVI|nr:uncharacterized protein LOC107982136 [Nasonia vitripennis]